VIKVSGVLDVFVVVAVVVTTAMVDERGVDGKVVVDVDIGKEVVGEALKTTTAGV
jgi:hypothetical protein